MGNIRNHNHFPFDLTPVKSDYWDFFLYLNQTWGGLCGNTNTLNLSAYIDTTIDECVLDNAIQSVSDYSYSKCVSKGIELKNIGFTGTDNGFVQFDKKTITSEEFDELIKGSVYKTEEGDCRLKLNAVSGNNGLFDYSNEIVEHDGVRCARLNGGFYQGFFMTGDGCEYKVLPNKLDENGWSLDFELKPEYFTNDCTTLNSIHPENRGIFFFMGTRAENKWVEYYEPDCEFEHSTMNAPTDTVEYVEHIECACDVNDCGQSLFFIPGYIDNNTCECANYFNEDYMELKEGNKSEGSLKETNGGHTLDEANLVEIETDNKYPLFDRSCEGVTVRTYEEGDKAVIQYRVINNDVNYFPLFNRSCDGMTANDYDEYFTQHANSYSVYKDLYMNAFALQIRNDGSVGYKYMVPDCDVENPECAYKIESEFTNTCEAVADKWVKIHVRILRMGMSDKMRIMIYVNGKLRLVSKDLPIFNFRKLSETDDKQEGVPFNISIGGGTQGLCDVIYNDFNKIPEFVYPLEKEFGGTFTGYFKTFTFYEKTKNFEEITCIATTPILGE